MQMILVRSKSLRASHRSSPDAKMTMALKLIQTTIQTKDEVIKSKDEFIQTTIQTKDEFIQTTIQTKDEVIKSKDEFIKQLSDQKDSLYKENKLLEEMRRTLEIESTPLLQLQGRTHVRGALELAADRARDSSMKADGVQGVINKRLKDHELNNHIRYTFSSGMCQCAAKSD
jgi:hypothetical protein